jgi:hypothetical protein
LLGDHVQRSLPDGSSTDVSASSGGVLRWTWHWPGPWGSSPCTVATGCLTSGVSYP